MKYYPTYFICFMLLVFFTNIKAQDNDSILLSIDTVTVQKKMNKTTILTSNISINKSPKSATQSISFYLENKSNFYVKQYGKGQLASVSFQGFGAAQTDIKWNDIKLNSPMLGQSDLNLLLLGNANKLTYNSNNSDNLGGEVELSQSIDFKTKNELEMAASFGSFVSSSGLLSYLYSKRKIFTKTLVSYQAAKNNFGYINPSLASNMEQEQQNAETKQLNIEEILAFKLNSRNYVKIAAKYFLADRNIAPSLFETNATENQKDQLALGSISWHHNYLNIESDLKTAIVFQEINYRFSSLSSIAKSMTSSWQSSFKINVGFTKKFNYKIKLENELESAQTSNYEFTQFRNKLKLDNEVVYKNNFFTSSIGFSEFFVNNKLSPFLPKASINFSLKKLPAKMHIGVRYFAKIRYPSLNDLYWIPGGNPDLKPETSQDFKLHIRLERRMNKINFSNHFEYFTIWASNYIQWQPNENSIWEAKNLEAVYSNGFYNELAINYTPHKNVILAFNFDYSYTRTNQKNNSKQLIYVPYTQLNFKPSISTKWFDVSINNHYTSERFSDKNHRTRLAPYYLLDINLGHEFQFKNKDKLALGIALNNITNQRYFTVINRPLPGFNFDISLKYKLNFIK